MGRIPDYAERSDLSMMGLHRPEGPTVTAGPISPAVDKIRRRAWLTREHEYASRTRSSLRAALSAAHDAGETALARALAASIQSHDELLAALEIRIEEVSR